MLSYQAKFITVISVFWGISIVSLICSCSNMQSYPSTKEKVTEEKSIVNVEAKIRSLVSKNAPPSLSVVVVKKNQVVYSKAFGYADFPNKKEATPQTTYQWWSLTKLFTATAILQLQEQGLLNINDPVQKYLPFFEVTRKGQAISSITIKQLLSHSSGLDDIGMKIISWIHYEGDKTFNHTELAKKQIRNYKKLRAMPSEKGMYSNLGYVVLAAIIEKVSGVSYDNYITINILQPLRMNHTGFRYNDSIQSNAAVGSHPKDFMSIIALMMMDREKAIREKRHGIYWFNSIYSNQQGSTGLIGSTEDFSHFLVAMMNHGVWDDKKILSAESVQQMQTAIIKVAESPAPESINACFGLSWFIHNDTGREALSHGGAGAAFVCHTRLYPKEKIGIAIMANSTYLGRDMGNSIINDLASLKW
jgi:D-alanyl-D-alanine carboxypeptidase